MPWSELRRRMPKSTQARALLTATFVLVSATLGVWLVIWLLFVRPKVEFVRARPDVAPVAFHSLSGLLPSGVGAREWRPLKLDSIATIRAYLDKHADRPMILYLAAPAISGRRDGAGVGGLEADGVVWKSVIPFEAIADVSVQKLIQVCQDRPGKAKLLSRFRWKDSLAMFITDSHDQRILAMREL